MMRKLFCFCALILIPGLPALQAADDDIAVIVNKGNPVENLSKVQLKKLLLGEQTSWPGGKRVNVILRAPGQAEREGVLRSVCTMSEDDFNQHLMHANFGGDTGGAPKALGSALAVRQLVMTLPGAVGFVRLADVTDAVRVVTVDGIAAGQPGYKIKAGK
uniref:PBP domain-containing protein n=1 Tax=Solibacter usitatus (strain Ellin6076) TaxID=234267 RepID=Q026E0_SOLUE